MRITVPGIGPRDARIVFVGEQPDKSGHIQGRPFVGAAGKMLDECLNQASITRGECYLTNVIKNLDAPLDHYVVKPDKKPPYWTPAGLEYLPFLQKEISDIHPNLVVAIGNVALFALTGRWGITKWRGSVVESTLLAGQKCIPCIHPATIIPPKNVYTNRLLIIQDLKKARKESLFKEIKLTHREVITNPTLQQIHDFLDDVQLRGRSGVIIDCDIETDWISKQVTCISFAYSPILSISIPFVNGNGDMWSPEDEVEIWRRIDAILGDPSIEKRGQNFIFDSHCLLRHYGIRVKGKVHDTMIGQKTLMPDYPAGLDFICSIHTDIPYYKDDGKEWMKKNIGGWDQFWQYNGTDTMATADAFPSIHSDLCKQGNEATYERKIKLNPILVYMMEKGIKFDFEGARKHREKVEIEVEELTTELHSLAGRELNALSPKQLKEYFYVEKGFDPYKKRTKNGFSISVDVDALKRLARKGVREATIISKLRTLQTKVLGTYLDEAKVSTDGRYRCSYKPVGTVTGRLSSSGNIFGEGTNKQNWPHLLLQFLLADEGYIYYGLDLSQAENRIVAEVGRITEMLRCFSEGIDVHALVGASIASAVLGEPVDWKEVKRQDKADEFCPLGDGTKTWRFFGKRTGHASNYDMGPATFALKNELKDNVARFLLGRYHGVFPEIRGNYQPTIRAMLAKDRTIVNLMGRRRLFMGQWGDDMFKEAYAQLPQSTVADVVDERGLIHIYYNQDRYREVELLEQVHDNIGMQIPISIGWHRHAEILLGIRKSLETPLVWHDREFVIPADLTMGLNLCKEQGHEFKGKGFSWDVDTLAKDLEDAYGKLTEQRLSDCD